MRPSAVPRELRCRCAARSEMRFNIADLAELSLPKNMSISFPEGKDKLMRFEITIKPDEGIYRWGPRERRAAA